MINKLLIIIIIIEALTIATKLAAEEPPTEILQALTKAAREESVPLPLLLAIAEKESAFGKTLDENHAGDGGHGRGIFQIDDRFHKPWLDSNDWRDPYVSALYASKLLKANFWRFRHLGDVPDLHRAAAVAAYNGGQTGVSRALIAGKHPDAATTGGNYSKSVYALAEKYRGYALIRIPKSPRPPENTGKPQGMPQKRSFRKIEPYRVWRARMEQVKPLPQTDSTGIELPQA